MKTKLSLVMLLAVVGSFALTGCNQNGTTSTPEMPSTNSPDMSSTNSAMPATNTPAQ
jgi:predicted small lipoprotein YifL